MADMLMLVKSLYMLILPPGGFILAFLAAAVWLYRRAGRKRAAALVLFLSIGLWLLSAPAVEALLLRPLEARYAPPPPHRFNGDVIIVLTGGATAGTPNIDGSAGHVSGATASRLLTAARLQRETGLPLIVSGGEVFPSKGNESDIAARELLGIGIPPDRIIQERQSRNTSENAKYSSALLREHGWTKPLLVTSAFHMPRSMAAFKSFGVEAVPVPTNDMAGRPGSGNVLDWIPSAQGLNGSGLALKEYLGLLAIGSSK